MNPETQKKIDEYLLLHALLDLEKNESMMEWFERRLRLEEPSSDDVYTIFGLNPPEFIPTPPKKRAPRMKYSFTPSGSQKDLSDKVGFLGLDGKIKTAAIDPDLTDLSKGEITIVWGDPLSEKEERQESHDSDTEESIFEEATVTRNIDAFTNAKSFPKKDHQIALIEIIRNYLDGDSPDTVASALIRRELPNTPIKNFTGDMESIKEAVSGLHKSYFPVQGPPGAGKTYVGAHLIHHLITAKGARVGIVSQSWSAIDNLLHKTLEVFKKKGDLDDYKNKFVRRKTGTSDPHPDIWDWINAGALDHHSSQTHSSHCLVAASSWLWVNPNMSEETKVDYLVIDEAGQFSLADALAVTKGAHNLVLLGDPQQLPQVMQAAHDFGAGASVLEHVVGKNRIIAPDQGSFLGKSFRMRPEICMFISEEFYEGDLDVSSDGRCSLRAIHSQKDGIREIQIMTQEIDEEGSPDCVIESEVEAQKVKETIRALKNTTWIDAEEIGEGIQGKEKKLVMENFMVVAPYNAQVLKICSFLEPNDFRFADSWTDDDWVNFQEFESNYYDKDADQHIKALEWWKGHTEKIVGTVDKFQGREAPVVIYSLTTSREDLIPAGRGDFIFSPNRLNVAISRAQCLAVLIGTEELVNSQAKSIEQMEALNHLCRVFEDRETTTVDGRMMIGETI